jgi:hypothetical protein
MSKLILSLGPVYLLLSLSCTHTGGGTATEMFTFILVVAEPGAGWRNTISKQIQPLSVHNDAVTFG